VIALLGALPGVALVPRLPRATFFLPVRGAGLGLVTLFPAQVGKVDFRPVAQGFGGGRRGPVCRGFPRQREAAMGWHYR